VFFAYNATKSDVLAALTAAQQWAGACCQESLGLGVQYAEGRGSFPHGWPSFCSPARSSPPLPPGQRVCDVGSRVRASWPEDPAKPALTPL
jgi:hypothetical protein